MKNKTSIFALLIAVAALSFSLVRGPGLGTQTPKETAFERVMRTRTIRCAYVFRPPFLRIDPNTKQVNGPYVEIMEAVGKVANLKIEWAEEVGYGSLVEQLRIGKEDVFCSGAWMSVPRGQRVEYSTAIEYTPLYGFAREADTRFDNNIEKLNNPDFTIATVDGSTMEAIAKASFPAAKLHALPGNSDDTGPMLAVATKKSDAVFVDALTIEDYNRNNPQDRLRQIVSPHPLRTFGAAFAVAKGEWELRDMLNLALEELRNSGTIKQIFSKYHFPQNAILFPASSYETEAK